MNTERLIFNKAHEREREGCDLTLHSQKIQ